MRQAHAAACGNLWITAETQQAGKARRGRTWVSEAGNLFASLLLINNAPSANISTLPFVASLAVAEAVKVCLVPDTTQISIKWPNDVLFNDKKLSGILLEASALPQGRQAVVIGCGINCTSAPQNPLYPATSLACEGHPVEPATLFQHLASSMHHYLTLWDGGRGFSKIRQQWLAQAAGLGKPIVARFDDHSQNGVFLDIDKQGLLVLETDNGKKLISAADIFFGIEQKGDS